MIANLITTIAVIAIHYNSKTDIGLAEIRSWNHLVQDFLTDGIARVAVPFFAISSGFFLVNRLNGLTGYINILKNKAITLLVPYLLSSTIISIAVLLLNKIFKPTVLQKINISSLVSDILLHPGSEQFWFLRDLLILIILSPILLKLNQRFTYMLVIILGTFWTFNIQPFPIIRGWYLLSIDTLFFFCLGGALSARQSLIESTIAAPKTVKLTIALTWFSLIGLRSYLEPKFDLWYVQNYTITSLLVYKLGIMIGLIALLQLSSLFAHHKRLIYISSLTFFAYLFHNIPLANLKILTHRVIADQYAFYINFPLAVLVVFGSAHLMATYLPRAYALITGNRTPHKALNRIT
jgi:Acyltransferase family